MSVLQVGKIVYVVEENDLGQPVVTKVKIVEIGISVKVEPVAKDQLVRGGHSWYVNPRNVFDSETKATYNAISETSYKIQRLAQYQDQLTNKLIEAEEATK